ncbi:hypothetical protein MTO96_008071 [Rhipicephalus appendiculatus]
MRAPPGPQGRRNGPVAGTIREVAITSSCDVPSWKTETGHHAAHVIMLPGACVRRNGMFIDVPGTWLIANLPRPIHRAARRLCSSHRSVVIDFVSIG